MEYLPCLEKRQWIFKEMEELEVVLPGNEEDPDGEEEEEEEREDDLDVGPGPEAQHTQQHQLYHLQHKRHLSTPFLQCRVWQKSALVSPIKRESDTLDFDTRFFFTNHFPPGPEDPIGAVSNLYENSRRYLQLCARGNQNYLV
jgi:hypothetical protein